MNCHEPDFEIPEAEKQQGYSSICRRCHRLLWSGCELIESACPGVPPTTTRRA